MDTRALQIAAITRGHEALLDFKSNRTSENRFIIDMFEKVSIWYAQQLVDANVIRSFDEQWIRDWASFVLTDKRWLTADEPDRDEYFLKVARDFFIAFHRKYNVTTDIDELFTRKTMIEEKAELDDFIKDNPRWFTEGKTG